MGDKDGGGTTADQPEGHDASPDEGHDAVPDEPDASPDQPAASPDQPEASPDQHRAPGRDGAPAGDEVAGHVLPDEVEYVDHQPGSGLPPRAESWRRRSATGAMLTGFAFGLREVLEVERREPAIVLETSGVPPKDLPVEADLENLPPRQSVVRIRRWLLTDVPEPTDNGPGGTGPGPAEEATTDPGVTFGADEAEVVTPTGRTTEIRSRKQRPRRFGRREGKRS